VNLFRLKGKNSAFLGNVIGFLEIVCLFCFSTMTADYDHDSAYAANGHSHGQ